MGGGGGSYGYGGGGSGYFKVATIRARSDITQIVYNVGKAAPGGGQGQGEYSNGFPSTAVVTGPWWGGQGISIRAEGGKKGAGGGGDGWSGGGRDHGGHGGFNGNSGYCEDKQCWYHSSRHGKGAGTPLPKMRHVRISPGKGGSALAGKGTYDGGGGGGILINGAGPPIRTDSYGYQSGEGYGGGGCYGRSGVSAAGSNNPSYGQSGVIVVEISKC